MVNCIQQVLEGASIELSSVAGNVVIASERAKLEAMIEGSEDPLALAASARRWPSPKVSWLSFIPCYAMVPPARVSAVITLMNGAVTPPSVAPPDASNAWATKQLWRRHDTVFSAR